VPTDDAARLTSVMTQVQADSAEAPTVEAIIAHAHELVPDAEDISITVRARRGRHETLGASSATAEFLDRLQYDMDEGPCIEAADDIGDTGTEWLRSGNLRVDPRWPRWGPQAADKGFESLLSIRLSARGERLGALNMYSRTSGAFSDREGIDLAVLYAVHVSYALASAKLVTGLEIAMESRHTIGLAQGILMERFGMDASAAFALLNRTASTQNRKVKDLAADLVRTGRFDT
jgi:hypothetical protein